MHETDVVGDDAVDLESREVAAAVLARRLAQLREAGVPAGGEVLHASATTPTPPGRARPRDAVGADTLVVGGPTTLTDRDDVHVVVVTQPASSPLGWRIPRPGANEVAR